MPATATNENLSFRRNSRKERSCVACRSKTSTLELLRFVRTPDGDLVLDWRRNLGGRGANVCATRECLERAVAEHRFEKSLKATVRYPEVESLLSSVRAAALRHVATLLVSCTGARVLAVGTDAVRKSLEKKSAACLLIADDASTKLNFLERAALAEVPAKTLGSKQFMGDLLGRRPTGVIAVENRGFAQTLLFVLNRLDALT